MDKNGINNFERNFLILKTIILGDFNSNKTQLFRNYVNNYLNHSYQQTIGLDIAGKDIYYNNRHIRVTINIISPLKRFTVIRKEFYYGTNIAFLVFDTTSEDSIKEVDTVWNNELVNYIERTINQAKILKILIGNNWEPGSNCLLTLEQVSKFVEKLNCHGYALCNSYGEILNSNSSGTMTNLHDIFIQAISKYLENISPHSL
jgi:GTPase SAR1 family protein